MKVVNVTSGNGKDLILDFIRSLPISLQDDCSDHIDLLKQYGFDLSSKYIKKVVKKPKLWELRVNSRVQVRFFFTLKNNHLVLLHGFIKKSQKTPQKALLVAIKRTQLV